MFADSTPTIADSEHPGRFEYVQQRSNQRIVTSVDPLNDPRWPSFLASHPDASIFHTREWLNAVHRTYNYKPIAFTVSNGEELSNAVVFCRIRSWLTGNRLVSLPFSDHCQPLAAGQDLV